MSLLRFFSVSPKGDLTACAGLAEAKAAAKGGGYAWLDFVDPSREDLAAVTEPLSLHPIAVENCLDAEQVPKLNEFPGHSFVLVNRFRYAGGAIEVSELDFCLGPGFLLSVNHAGSEAPQALAAAMDAAVAARIDSVKKGPDFLLHAIVDCTVDDTFPAIEAIEDDIDAVQESILERGPAFVPEELIRLRRLLLVLRKGLLHEREVLTKICRKDSPHVTEKAIYHFRDVADHLARFFESIEIGREMITSLMEIHLSLANNDMARAANSTNRTVRRLTLITTIFMPLTLLAGIGGMSEWSMMTGPSNWRIAYPLFLAGMVIVAAVNWWLLKWYDGRSAER